MTSEPMKEFTKSTTQDRAEKLNKGSSPNFASNKYYANSSELTNLYFPYIIREPTVFC